MRRLPKHLGDVTFYDYAGQRVRKVTDDEGSKILHERRYIETQENYTRTDIGIGVVIDRTSVHVMDGERRVAIVDVDNLGGKATYRYQFTNHLGTASLELDEDANIISYEEYYPYGNTSFQSGDSADLISLKRYRYIGKERDEQTGFYYMGARYYVPWLGRWLGVDPISDEWYNLCKGQPQRSVKRQFVELCASSFEYCYANPIRFTDPSGEQVPGFDLNTIVSAFQAFLQPSNPLDGGMGTLGMVSQGINAGLGAAGNKIAEMAPNNKLGLQTMPKPGNGRDDSGLMGTPSKQDITAHNADVMSNLLFLIPGGEAEAASTKLPEFGVGFETAGKAFAEIKTTESALSSGKAFHGTGSVPGVIEVSSRATSTKAFESWNSARGVEYVFDSKNEMFAMGKTRVGGGSPHQNLVRSMGVPEGQNIVGGTVSSKEGVLNFTENSGHFGENWTPKIREQFSTFLRSHSSKPMNFVGFKPE